MAGRSAVVALCLAGLSACSSGDGPAPDSTCETVCARIAAAGCPLEDALAVCVADCGAERADVGADCRDEEAVVLSCFAAGTWTCAEGRAVPPAECAIPSDALDACRGGVSPPPLTLCEAACANGAGAGCPADVSVEACVAGCDAFRARGPAACTDEGDRLLACLVTGTWTCVDGHSVEPAECGALHDAVIACPCEAACAAVEAAGCPLAGPLDTCVAECAMATTRLPADCQDELSAAYACWAGGAWTCVEGSPTAPAECAPQSDALLACLGPPNAAPSVCELTCDGIAGAGCPLDASPGECLAACGPQPGIPVQCVDEHDALLACLAAGTWTCVDGRASGPPECAAASDAFAACLAWPLETRCAAYCASVAAAACPGDPPEAVCAPECVAAVSSMPSCQVEMSLLLSCQAAGEWACVDGLAEPQALCATEVDALTACMDGGAGGGAAPPPGTP